MSLNVNPIGVKMVMDPRLEIQDKRNYIAVKGSMVTSWQTYPSANVSNNTIQITCNPPSASTAIARLVFKKFSFNWSVTGTNTSGGKLLVDGNYGPRCMPITSVTATESMSINNDVISESPISDYWRAFLRYRNNHDNRNGPFSLAPSMLDQFQSYFDGVGTTRNALGVYGDNPYENTRASYTGFTIDPQDDGNVVATGTLTSYEPILISPFGFGNNANYMSSFVGVNNMSYSCTFGNLSRILSLVQDQSQPGFISLDTPVVNVTSAEIIFNYFSIDQVMPIPRVLESSYFSIVCYETKTTTPKLPGETVKMTMTSVQVSSIPKRIYIYAKSTSANETAFTTDTYLALDPDVNPISIQWDTNQFMSQATIADLYNISVKNGCNMSFSEYTKFCGSVLAIDFGAGDIGLQSNQSAGSFGSYQLQVTANFKNVSSDTLTPSLFVVIVNEGVFNIINGTSSRMTGVLSPQDVLNAQIMPPGSYKESQEIYGGRFEVFKKMLNAGHKFIKDNKIISRSLGNFNDPYSQGASQIARSLGYGRMRNRQGRGLSGGNLSEYAENNENYNENDNENEY